MVVTSAGFLALLSFSVGQRNFQQQVSEAHFSSVQAVQKCCVLHISRLKSCCCPGITTSHPHPGNFQCSSSAWADVLPSNYQITNLPVVIATNVILFWANSSQGLEQIGISRSWKCFSLCQSKRFGMYNAFNNHNRSV